MARTELRDKHGKVIGWTEKCGCRVEAYDAGGRLCGWHHPDVNQTYDAGGRLVGKADMLAALILW